jgi:hypothetical protein
MLRRVTAGLVLLVLGSTIGSGDANADADHPETIIYGATVGLNWGDFPSSPTNFPSKLRPTYEGTDWWQQLDITLPIYLVWEVLEVDPGGVNPIVPINPPIRIDVKFGNAPEPCPDYIATQLVASYEYEDYSLYTECSSGNRIEAPLTGSTPINQDGTIRVRDIFGGTGAGTKLILTKDFPPCTPVDGNHRIIVVISWNEPGRYLDASTGQPVDALPGTVVNREYTATSLTGNDLVGYYPQLTVLWPSADFAPISSRVIDASDVAAYFANAQNPVTWGFDGGPSNFQYNVNPFGDSANAFDSGDIAVLGAHLGHCCGSAPPCQLPGKSGDDDERAAILTWFGIAATGRRVIAGPEGETIPEYDIVDRAQNLRAIADPYGYQRIGTAAGRLTPWGRVKGLYR